MKTSLALSLLAIVLLACTKQAKPVTMPGADRDAHGCIGSAGYRWCEKTTRCERPWELAKKENFELSDHKFTQFCQ